MDEKRKYFRIKNKGDIEARYGNLALEVIDISSAGALVIRKNTNLQQDGLIELIIHNLSLPVHYNILRVENDTMTLTFNIHEENERLFQILKQMKKDHLE